VHVIVIGHAGTRDRAEVHPDIEAVRMIDVGKDALRGGGEADERVQRTRGAVEQARLMRDRGHHHVSVRVGIAIEHDQRIAAAIQRERVERTSRIGGCAEDA
jgi:hypothetical protein